MNSNGGELFEIFIVDDGKFGIIGTPGFGRTTNEKWTTGLVNRVLFETAVIEKLKFLGNEPSSTKTEQGLVGQFGLNLMPSRDMSSGAPWLSVTSYFVIGHISP